MSSTSYATIKSVAARLAVKDDTIYTLVRNGQLQAINVSTKEKASRPTWRISLESVEAFEASRTVTPPAAKPARRASRKSTPARFYA